MRPAIWVDIQAHPTGRTAVPHSILVAVGAGVQAGHNVAEAVLVGVAAFAAAAKFLDWLII